MRPAPLEQALVAHLRPLLGVPVSTRVPSSRPDRFLLVSRTGGTRSNLGQSRPVILVEAWAKTDGDSWALASDAYNALDALPYQDEPLGTGVYVADCDLADPVNYPDSQSGTPRYQFVATLTVNLQE